MVDDITMQGIIFFCNEPKSVPTKDLLLSQITKEKQGVWKARKDCPTGIF
jgi:hypothetical protein